jgi:hypothetical protein
MDKLTGECGVDFVPNCWLGVPVVGDEFEACGGRLVLLYRLHTAIVDGKLLKVGEDAQRKISRPRIAPKLHRRGHVLGDGNRRLLRGLRQ